MRESALASHTGMPKTRDSARDATFLIKPRVARAQPKGCGPPPKSWGVWPQHRESVGRKGRPVYISSPLWRSQRPCHPSRLFYSICPCCNKCLFLGVILLWCIVVLIAY